MLREQTKFMLLHHGQKCLSACGMVCSVQLLVVQHTSIGAATEKLTHEVLCTLEGVSKDCSMASSKQVRSLQTYGL